MNIKYNLKYLLVLNLIFLTQFAISKHIVGGEVTYKLVSSDGVLGGFATYDVKFVIYRDAESGGADFDLTGYFGIYYKNGDTWKVLRRVDKAVGNTSYIKNVNDPCVISPSNILYEKGEYNFTVQLEIINAPYMLTYQRCCRTNFILNIEKPEATGATYFVEISPEAQLAKNNSPVFKSYPPAVLCANMYFNIDIGATDQDGDSLAYEFFNPFDGGGLKGSEAGTAAQVHDCAGVQPDPMFCPPPYPLVKFVPPYSYINPMEGNPKVQINPLTGFISGTPQNIGQFVVGVRVKEYRNGQLLGTIQRDFQFNVVACAPLVNANIGNSTQLSIDFFEIFSCGKDTVTFINNSYEKSKISTVLWKFNINGTIVTSDEWNGVIPFPGPGVYSGKLLLNQGGLCSDSASVNVKIFPGVHALFDYKFDTCSLKNIEFNNHSFSEAGPLNNISWNFGDGTKSSNFNTGHLFKSPGNYNISLIVEDKNKCKDTMQNMINYFPVPDNFEILPSQYIGCAPVPIKFNNNTVFVDESYKFQWDFGDGTFSNEKNPEHNFNDPGSFNVKLSLESPTGCKLEHDFSDYILIKKGPKADFDYQPKNLSIVNPVVHITNNSSGGSYHFWDFGNGDVSYLFEPEYTYNDTGKYNIMYVITSTNQCTDTLIKAVDISPDVLMFYPNAFTPNGDGKNDEFFGKGSFLRYMLDFQLTIWDRWGGMVFETKNPDEHWNGRKNNSGELLPQGVYVYTYFYKTPRGKIVDEKGFVTLIK